MTTEHHVTTDNQVIAYGGTGTGPPLLLLHGFPQTRAMWRPLLPALSRSFTVITADLRGYGDSSKPATMPELSFRNMARDMVSLMAALGHAEFHVAGHDRGARTAHRMALDHPETVQSLTVMDIVPTEHLLTHMTTGIAKAYYHWFFLAQPEPFPVMLIGSDPDIYFERCLLGFGKASLDDFEPDLLAAYRAAWRDPQCIRAMCHDYRAAIEIDWEHDRDDLHRTVACPAFVLYGKDGAMAQMLDLPATWADRLDSMQHAAIDGGHFFPDQSPTATAEALHRFLVSQ